VGEGLFFLIRKVKYFYHVCCLRARVFIYAVVVFTNKKDKTWIAEA
jgi:hypothetical protein